MLPLLRAELPFEPTVCMLRPHISCQWHPTDRNDVKVLRPVSSGRIVPFQIASQLRCAVSGFKQVERAYLAAITRYSLVTCTWQR